MSTISLCVQAEPLEDWSTPDAVVRIFEEACLAGGEQPASIVDWALAHGFDPVDAQGSASVDLLNGEPGTVLAAPTRSGPTRVWLAGGGSQCTVWVEGVTGGPLRLALAQRLAGMANKGARVQLQVDRSVERAGAWRSQQQWRFRAAAGKRDLGLGAVTTLTEAPGNQALNMTPLPPALTSPAFAPDGVPAR